MNIMVRYRDQVVGAFVLAAIVLLAVALMFVGVNKRWFKRDPQFASRFLTAEGLSPGLAVELRGFAIGHVQRLRLDAEDQVEVTLAVHEEYADRIVSGSVLELTVQPLGFGSSLELHPGGADAEAMPPGSVIPSTDMPVGRALLAQGVVDRPRRRDAVSGLLAMLPPLVGEAESLVTTLDQLLARLDTRLMGPVDEPAAGLLTTVDATTREFGELAAAVGRSAGELDAVVANLAAFSTHLAAPEGLIPTLLGDQGSAAMLFHDQAELYARLTAAMDEMVALAGFLNESAPALGVLMDETIRTLAESEKVLQGLKNNPILRGGIPPAVATPGTFEGRRTDGD